MTPKERAAMQQALDALEKYADWRCTPETDQTITALREALSEPDIEEMTLTQIAARHEQAEQEPVAYQEKMSGVLRYGKINDSDTPLYSHPVRTKDPCHPWQDLTDEEIEEIGKSYFDEWSFGFARAVIAADREKNK